jgi:peptidoglycan/LPS O-acetylase OafA/YrhL
VKSFPNTKNSKPSSALPFLPGVEGLRALAVVAVLLYHIDLNLLPGGFLGVDLFFVISGFIISRSILFQLKNSQFSIKRFYYRRFRRLFPALIATILLALIAAVAVVPPRELMQASCSAVYAILSLANFHYWWSWSYFDTNSSGKLFLHTWSLSLEEQFYLLWPVLLLFSFRLNLSRKLLVVSLLVASLLFSALMMDNDPIGLFYLLPYRIHQLMAGALVAVLSLQFRGGLANVLTFVASVGFVLICAIPLGGSSLSGAWAASFFGFCLIASHQSGLSQLLYANSVMQWLGKRSYALYLVHWPVIVLSRFSFDFQLSSGQQLFVILLSVSLAMLLHKFVERPLRLTDPDERPDQRRPNYIIGLSVLTTGLVTAFYLSTSGVSARVPEEISSVVNTVELEKRHREIEIRTGKCNLQPNHSLNDYREDECAALVEGSPSLLIIGDSFAADSYMMLKAALPGVTLMQATGSACPALLYLESTRTKRCRRYNNFRFSHIARLDVDVVVLASRWKIDQIPELKITIEYLKKIGKKVVVLGPGISFWGEVPVLLSDELSLQSANRNISRLADRKTELLKVMRDHLPGVDIVDITSLQCTPDCAVTDNGELLYLDGFHLTVTGARLLGRKLADSKKLSMFLK